MECPHCKHALTLKEAVIILNGSGYVRKVRVRLPNGAIVGVEAADCNPNTMDIVDE